MIVVTCSSCGMKSEAPRGAVGRSLPCPKCGEGVVVCDTAIPQPPPPPVPFRLPPEIDPIEDNFRPMECVVQPPPVIEPQFNLDFDPFPPRITKKDRELMRRGPSWSDRIIDWLFNIFEAVSYVIGFVLFKLLDLIGMVFAGLFSKDKSERSAAMMILFIAAAPFFIYLGATSKPSKETTTSVRTYTPTPVEEDYVEAFSVARTAVRACLKYPYDAKFSIWDSNEDYWPSTRIWKVTGTVKAPNGFGLPITQRYYVEIDPHNNWDVKCVIIGGEICLMK